MGCFLFSFFSSKNRNRRNHRNYVSNPRQTNGGHDPLKANVSPVVGITEKAPSLVPELSEKSEEQLSLCTRKRVTFDSRVEAYEGFSVNGSTDSLPENNDNGRSREKEEGLAKTSQPHVSSEDDSVISSVGSYPQNHRYQNWRDSDDEELEYEDSVVGGDSDDCYSEGDDGSMICQGVWLETIPTQPMKSRTEVSLTRVASEEVDSPMTLGGLPEQEEKLIGLNKSVIDTSAYDHPVLNPVENLNQWKTAESKGTPWLKPDQTENSAADEEANRVSFSSELSFRQSSFSFKPQSDYQLKNLHEDIAFVSSFSTWLNSSETTPEKKTSSIELGNDTSEPTISHGSTSVTSIEDKPILGALTLEELKQSSASSSPRKSPSRSPDDMYIIGTVGTYWKHSDEEVKDCGFASSCKTKNSGPNSSYKGIPNTNSKYSEDKIVNWHSAPFETRLERALNRGAAEA